MKIVKDVITVAPAVALTAAAVLIIGVAMSLSSWALL